ncbi:MAG: cyclic nucleotide-binding domain-containing protein [Elusimicrobiota bacterium]
MKRLPMPKAEYMSLAWSLRKIDFFCSLSPDQVQELFPEITLAEYQPGEVVCRQGDPGDALYILKSGRLTISVKKGWFGSSKPVGAISAGEVFGELALLSSQPRTATIVAAEASQVYLLMQADFWRALDRSPAFDLEVRKVAERRKLRMQR